MAPDRTPWTPLDLLLGAGTEAERAAARARLLQDPEAAADLHATEALLSGLRRIDVDGSPQLRQRLLDTEQQLRRLSPPRPAWPRWSLLLAAAAVLLLTPMLPWHLLQGATPSVPVWTASLAGATVVGETEVESRVRLLAQRLAAALPAALQSAGEPTTVAAIAQALVASGQADNGGPFGPDLRLAQDWLQQQLPRLHGGPLATTLLTLGLVAAEIGSEVEPLRQHAQRFVDESLQAFDGGVAAGLFADDAVPASLGDGGRLLAMAPAFGVEPAAAQRLRRLLLHRLQAASLPAAAQAARLYGYADLIDRAPAATALAASLSPTVTTADLGTLRQAAAGHQQDPHERRTWSGFLLRLRHLAAAPLPPEPEAQAELLLCLASSSFVDRSCSYARLVAFAQRQ